MNAPVLHGRRKESFYRESLTRVTGKSSDVGSLSYLIHNTPRSVSPGETFNDTSHSAQIIKMNILHIVTGFVELLAVFLFFFPFREQDWA